MGRLIVSRLLQLPLILAVIFAVTFVLAWAVPGNPVQRTERRPPKEIEEAMKRQYNLDNWRAFLGGYLEGLALGDRTHRNHYDTSSPWAATRSYFSLLWHGSDGYRPPYLGPSLIRTDQAVNDIILQGLPYSAALGAAALVIALIIGIGAGLIGAVRPGSPLELGSLSVSLIGVSLPMFVTGSLLLVLCAAVFHWAPIGNWDWPGWAFWLPEWWTATGRMLQRMALPALTLALAPAGYIARLTRLGLADVMNSDYIRTAKAKGLSPRRILFKHALKVAFLPVLSFLGPAAAWAMTGSFVVEQVYSIQGLGIYFVTAVRTKDQFLILGLVLVYSTLLIVFNLLVDLAYAWVDPRIEL